MWRPTPNLVDRLLVGLLYAMQRLPAPLAHALYLLLCLRGTDIHPHVRLGPGLRLQHGAIGVVVHSKTTIGRNVTIYQGVTVGRADIWCADGEPMTTFAIGDEAILCAGAAVLGRGGELRVGAGTIVGANSVLTQSTGEYEIWAGAPARLVGPRPRPTTDERAEAGL